MNLPAALLVLAVAVASTPDPSAPALAEGAWGGADVSLEVTPDGGRLEFDCAHGSLSRPVVPDADGRFDVPGVYTVEGPGPARPENEAGAPARYVGRISDGNTMTLSVRPNGSDAEIGPFTLTRGVRARITKCR